MKILAMEGSELGSLFFARALQDVPHTVVPDFDVVRVAPELV